MKIPKISFEREGHPAPAADRLNGFARRQGFPRSRRQMLVAVLLPLLAFIGCAREPGKTGFPAVQTAARNRIGKEIRWKDAAGEESAIAERVKELLAGELNADAAVQVALLNNRRMQALYEDLEIAQADLVQASLLPNPIAEGSLKASTNGGASPEIELGVVENFVSILTIPLKRKIAKAEFESVKAHVTQEVLALASEVRGQFYVVQADHQMIEMLGHVTETTGASLDAARRLHEAGNIRDLDLSAEEAVDAQARLDLAEAEVKAMKNRERLNILLGLWGEEAGLEVSTRLADVPDEELPADDVEKRVIEKNIELEMLRREIESAAARLGLARSTALLPDGSVGVNFKRETDGNHLLGPFLSLPIPFFDRGQGRLRESRAQLRQAQETLYYKAVEARAAARAARDHLQLARKRAIYMRDTYLPLQQKMLEQEQLEYNAMQIGVFDLLRAKRGEIEAGRQYIEDLRDYWLARAEMESLLSGHVTQTGMETTALDSIMGSALH